MLLILCLAFTGTILLFTLAPYPVSCTVTNKEDLSWTNGTVTIRVSLLYEPTGMRGVGVTTIYRVDEDDWEAGTVHDCLHSVLQLSLWTEYAAMMMYVMLGFGSAFALIFLSPLIYTVWMTALRQA